jgi:hypothetical protein
MRNGTKSIQVSPETIVDTLKALFAGILAEKRAEAITRMQRKLTFQD